MSVGASEKEEEEKTIRCGRSKDSGIVFLSRRGGGRYSMYLIFGKNGGIWILVSESDLGTGIAGWKFR